MNGPSVGRALHFAVELCRKIGLAEVNLPGFVVVALKTLSSLSKNRSAWFEETSSSCRNINASVTGIGLMTQSVFGNDRSRASIVFSVLILVTDEGQQHPILVQFSYFPGALLS